MKIVRYVGKGKTLPSEYKKAIGKGTKTAIVDTLPGDGNVTLRMTLDGRRLELTNDSLTRDFLDLATLIYIVDEIEPRSLAKDHWSRRFDVIVPVKKPKLWAKHEELFRKMLHTLAGDDYHFIWMKRPKLGSLGHHRTSIPPGFDTVCLFSGGMDSFLGAYKLLKDGKKLLLVGHQADGTAASAQKALAKWLQKRFPDSCHLIQCRVARSFGRSPEFRLPAKREETHRPRSLLFIALAVTIANATGAKTVVLPENGLIAINAPLQKSRLGTLSTRTAHPRYLSELADFLHAAGVFRGDIKNPFLFLSKTDMLQRVKALSKPLLRSVSCARPSRYKNKGVRHCGYCVPCIYRRVAMAEAELDSKDDYAFSVFDDLLELETHKQLDFRALVRWAERVVSASAVERELMVLSHGSFPVSAGERFGPKPTSSYSVWADMLLRWSEDFLAKVDTLSAPTVKRALGRMTKKRLKVK